MTMGSASRLFDLSNYYYNPYAIPFLLAAFLILFVGGYVFAYSARRLRMAFALLCGLIFVWLFTTILVYCSRYPSEAEVYIRFMYFGISFIPPSLCLYVSVWLKQWERNRRALVLGYVLGAAFFLLIFGTRIIVGGVSSYFWGFHSRLTPLGTSLFIPYFFGYVVIFFITLYRGYRAAEDLQLKKQVFLVTLAFVFAFFATMDFFPCFGISIFPTGGLLLFCAFCVMAYTIIRYKMFDIETVVHMTVMWLTTSTIAVLPFAGLVYSTQPLLKDLTPVGASLYCLTLTLVFYFYFRLLQPRLGQLFQRQQANLQAIFDQFSKELVHLQNLRDLLQSLARLLRRQLYVRRLSIYLFDEASGEFLPMIAKGIRNLQPFSITHPFLRWLEKNDAVTAGELVVANPDVEEFKDKVIECFTKTQSSVVVPFVLGNELIGMAFLGKRANLKPYRFREVQFFNRLKAPVTIAFSNSMRFEDIRKLSEELQKWNLELEQRVEDRTRELVKTQEQLIQAEKLATLGTLAGGVAHEINNPLTAVLTNAQILRMSAKEDDIDSISLIEEGAKRCQAIVQKLMKYARKTAEEVPLKPVDLNEVVKSTVALIGFQFKQENVELVIELGAVPQVAGIAGELEQVLTNLLVNARDAVLAASANGKSKGRITVRTQASGGAVEMIVSDNGVGIPKEHLTKIFDPFFTTKDVGAGTGLGLAVSLGILKRHSAAITADSAVGKGTTFTIRFPLVPSKA